VTARMVEFPRAVEPQRQEWFIAGTEPRDECSLHRGGLMGWLDRLRGP